MKGDLAMSEFAQCPRNPSTAANLSFLCTGLGHIYCGRFTAGLVLCFLALSPVPFLVAAVVSQNPSVIFFGIIIPCLFALFVYVYSIVASYRLAKRIGDRYELKDYNNGVVYALFIVGEIFFTVTVAISVAFYARAAVLEAFYCPAGSMSPAILKGDRFLVNKLVQRKLPQRGDIIVFLAPDNRDLRYVKRVIGLPGDSIAVRGDDVYLNGRKLEHRPAPAANQSSHSENVENMMFETNGEAIYRIQFAEKSAEIADFPETKIPAGNCFVIGDNRNQSHDSRKFGCVPLGDILGKAEYLYYPVSNWSRFGALGN
jgi:signal peptidase I